MKTKSSVSKTKTRQKNVLSTQLKTHTIPKKEHSTDNPHTACSLMRLMCQSSWFSKR